MIVVAIGLAVAACGASDVDPVPGLVVDDGFRLQVVAEGLDGPTQLTVLSDGRLLVAELNGGESDGVGRILALDPEAGTEEILYENLLKPTGVTVIGEEIWVMEERTLSRGPVEGGTLTVVADQLPFNGRSESTLTPTDRGTLIYATSGSLGADGRPRDGSGILWEHDPVTDTATPLSAGLKNAYGHTFDPDGQLWATEVSDGRFDGEPAPDELVRIEPGVDHGWPRCIGDRLPVRQFGAGPADCATGPGSQALFASGATPTSVAVAPWDPETLLVALWLERRIVAVPAGDRIGDAPFEPVEVVGGELRPQHLVADGDRLLIVDFDGGRVLEMTAEDG